MTVQLNIESEEALKQLAEAKGQRIEELLAEAIRDYVIAAATNDVSAQEIAESQAKMLPELINEDEDWRTDEQP